MRILFAGSGDFGLPTLEHLHAHHELVAVLTQPDRPAGRRRKLTPTPVARRAEQLGVEVLKLEDVNTPEAVAKIASYEARATVVVAFGQKLSPAVVEAMGELAVNLHASILPKYRGAGPINWAIIRGERTTGVSVIGLAQKMDAGPVYATAELTIGERETAGELHDRLAALGPGVIEQVLADLDAGTLEGAAQDDARATLAPKLKKDDATVRFDQPAEAVRDRVHGLTPWPGCRVNWHCGATGRTETLLLRRVEAVGELPEVVRRQVAGEPEPGLVLDPLMVVCGSGAVRLLEVQGPGTRAMAADAFARGHHLAPGDRLEPTHVPARW